MWHVSHANSIPFVSGPMYNWNISTKGYKMPNWVYNGLTVEGNPDSVTKMKEQLNKPFKQMHDSWNMETHQHEKKVTLYPEPIFAFHNIYSYLDAGISEEDYLNQPAQKSDMTDWFKFEGNDWYNFNVREWGTKWDVAVSSDDKYPDTNFEEADNGENKVIHYNFQTAWSRPLAGLEKLSAQYPDLLFTLSYEEETGWGGEMEFLRGKVISESEYDNQCRDCDATDQMEYCENDCGEICANCNWLGEADLEAVAKCQTHAIYLETKVPEYRKAKS